ncbi:NAD(P)-binding domain-containing protein [Aneurinibacillus sp. Ricciae_BoGa-3]|uniref:NADPH-dependent F420 reductase n=1 Tax=Aneurinibacillus sp. Ricciae_BoGa-3 TaxID=3022697 RepID=UPI00234203B3|nr:NAD(P)-binding domain-containing protein [Aneurinibacillus sp. Ricciae_BoGa-3]WCK54926.1 NAD(P)-binding domain-containing protein [Aneurinibacillus sp. Ricciae_BoGa-3]
MKLSVVGSGRMGQGLVKVLSPFINGIVWGSRSVEKVNSLIQELNCEGVVPATYQAALNGDVIIHSLWYKDLLPFITENKEKLAGKILVDIVNPFTDDFSDFTTEWGTSAAEEVQKLLPNTRVVGAFKNTFFKVLQTPINHGLQSDVYVTSDDEEARREVMGLLKPAPFRILDGGLLKNNRTIERMTLFEREVAQRYGHYPYVSFRIFGNEETI